MAQQGAALGGAAAGALLGSFIPGVGWVLGAQIGLAAGSVLGAALFPQKGPKPQKEDLTVQAASYGTPISILAGTDRAAGTMFWVKDNELQRVAVDQGGKGFMGGGGATTYEIRASWGIILGEGPIQGVRRVWFDTKLVHDRSAASLSDIIANGGQAVSTAHMADGSVNIYLGTEDQLPDPHIQADRGADNVSAMRGLACAVFINVPLADFANHIPNVSVEYVKNGTLHYLYRDLDPDVASSQAGSFTFLDANQPALYTVFPLTGVLTRFDLASGAKQQANHASLTFGNGAPTADEFGSIFVGANAGDDVVYRFDQVTLVHTGTGEVIEGANLNYGGLIYRHYPAEGVRWLLCPTFGGEISIYDAATLQQLTLQYSALSSNGDIGPDGAIYVAGTNGVASLLNKHALVPNPDFGTTSEVPFVIELSTSFDLTATHGTDLDRVHYYADEDVLICAGGNNVVSKVDPATGAVIASLNVPSGGGLRPVNGRLWTNNLTTLYEIDVASMTLVRSILVTNWVNEINIGNVRYDGFTDSIALQQFSNKNYQYFIPRIDPLDVDRADVITQYSGLAGLTASQINVSLVTTTVKGLTVRRQTTARDALEPVLQVGFLDAVEKDGKLWFVPRGQSVTLTVPEEELGAGLWGEDDDAQKLIETLPQEINRPERVLIRAPNRDNQYDTDAQAAKRAREIMRSREQMTFDVPEVLSADDGMQLAEQLLYSFWAEYPVKFSLPPKYRKLIPTDVITLTVGALSFRVRLTKVDDGPYLACEGMVEEPAAYISTALGGPADIPGQVLQLLSPTQLFLIDSTLLRDEDDDAGHYLAIAPTVPDGLWGGAQIHKSSDQVSFEPWRSYSAGVEYGIAESALPDHHCTTTDDYNSLVIAMVNGDPPGSCTDFQLYTGSNAFLLQSGSDWELIQARDITDLGNRRYRLATLLRGRRGTEQQAAGHAAGDKIIVLSASTMQRTVNAAEIGMARYYKATTRGAFFTPTGAVAFTNSARGLMPYAPTQIGGTRNGAGDITCTWQRRTRVFGTINWSTNPALPLGETDEIYKAEILDALGTTVLRTKSGLTSPTFPYPAAEQVTDFGSTQSAVKVRIRQIGTATSIEGRAATATI